MISGTTYRRKNGRRLGQTGLAQAISQDVTGMMLAQAFVLARRAGFRLVVCRLDGAVHRTLPSRVSSLYVDVKNGIVCRCGRVSPI